MFRAPRVLHTFKRMNSHSSGSAGASTAKSSFNNKYNFNTNPPPVHEYWNIRNTSVLLAFIPIYLSVSYLTKRGTSNVDGYGGLVEYANSEKSPMKDIKFGEPQVSKN